LYIPLPVSDDDIIPLAPLDEEEERRAEELRRESITYAASVDKDAPRGGAAAEGAAERAAAAPGEVVDYAGLVQRFVVAMHGSKLDEAETIVSRLRKAGVRARDYVDGLFLDQMPPNIKGVPAPLAKSFLKNLLDRLG
jgi:hypothetical protein